VHVADDAPERLGRCIDFDKPRTIWHPGNNREEPFLPGALGRCIISREDQAGERQEGKKRASR
jgi:hypothetical protein